MSKKHKLLKLVIFSVFFNSPKNLQLSIPLGFSVANTLLTTEDINLEKELQKSLI